MMVSATRRGLSKQQKPSRQDMGTKSECFKKWKTHVEGNTLSQGDKCKFRNLMPPHV
jgi:hypothetical protein